MNFKFQHVLLCLLFIFCAFFSVEAGVCTQNCDDSNPCTEDSCDYFLNTCVHESKRTNGCCKYNDDCPPSACGVETCDYLTSKCVEMTCDEEDDDDGLKRMDMCCNYDFLGVPKAQIPYHPGRNHQLKFCDWYQNATCCITPLDIANIDSLVDSTQMRLQETRYRYSDECKLMMISSSCYECDPNSASFMVAFYWEAADMTVYIPKYCRSWCMQYSQTCFNGLNQCSRVLKFPSSILYAPDDVDCFEPASVDVLRNFPSLDGML